MKRNGKRILALMLSCLLLVGMMPVVGIAEDVATSFVTATYDDDYRGTAPEGLTVENNSITGSDFTVTMAEGHSYKFDDSNGDGLTWWSADATEENSGIKFGFDAVDSGALVANYRFRSNLSGSIGSLVSGSDTVAEVYYDASAKTIGSVSKANWTYADMTTVVDLSANTYVVYVDGTEALSGNIEEGTSIDGLYFDVTGQNWFTIVSVKVEVYSAPTAKFYAQDGTLIEEVAIENGSVTAPSFDAPEGTVFAGWVDKDGNVLTADDIATLSLSHGAEFTATLDGEDGVIVVGTEDALVNAITNALTDGTETTILLLNDIDIARTSAIPIAAGQNIKITGDYTLTKTGSHTNAFMTVASGATLVVEDVDIDLNGATLNKNGVGLAVSGTATLKGSAELKNGLMAGNDSAVQLGGSGIFTMEGNSKITGWSSTTATVSTAIIRPVWGGTFNMRDNAEISGNTVKEAIFGATSWSYASDRNTKVNLYGGKIINNTITTGYAINISNDSGSNAMIFDGSVEVDDIIALDDALKITSALEYPVVYQYSENLTADGTTDADGDGIVDYYTKVVALGSDYTLTTDDLEKISIYNENDDYIPCLKASDGKIYIMDADADARDGYTAKSVTKYTVNFYDGDETTIMKTQLVRAGKDATPPDDKPTKANDDTNSYIFQDWEDYTNITADRDVYPVFEAVDLGNVYTVIFVDGDGNELKSEQVLEGYSATAPDETPTKTGATGVRYEFREWDTAFDNITADTTVTALFDTYYTVTFKYGLTGGTTKTAEVKEGEAATTPEITNPTDWEFAGWDVDLTNITSAITATAQYNYTGDYLYEVSNETELRDAIAIAYTDAENPITIKLLNDIEITSTSTTLGNFAFTNQNIIFTSDNGYNIIKAHKAISRLDYGQLYQKAFIGVSGGNITFDGVGIDLNVDDDRSNGGRALYIAGSGKVTLKNASIKDGGFSKATSGNSDFGTAVIMCSGCYFTMEEGAKITGFASNEAKEGNLIYFDWGGNFVMNGGEISGNTVNYEALISAASAGAGNGVVVRLEGGKIINNTWPESVTTKWAHKGLGNNGQGALYLGTNMEIEGVIGGIQGQHYPKVTGAITYPVTIVAPALGANTKRDDNGNAIVGAYGNAIVRGSDYTLTTSDLKNVYWTDETDNGLVLYLDTKANGIYALDEGTEQRYPDRWITKAEADIVTYTVTFVNWDDEVIETQTIVEGASATAPADPTKTVDGQTWKFTGWDTEFDAVTDNLTIKAQYIQIFTVNFYGAEEGTEDNEVILTQQVEAGQAATAPEVNPEKASDENASYNFAGWSTTFDAVSEDLNIYPTFNAVTKLPVYTVTFYDADGAVIGEAQSIEQGKAATAPADPTKTVDGEIWRFTGWDKAYTNVQSDLDIYPTFIQQFTVTFVGYENATLGTATVDSGSSATAPEVPDVLTYYTFAGTWDTAFDAVTEDITVTAQYTYIGGRTFDVTTAAQFREVIRYVPADGELITINILNDIDFDLPWSGLTNVKNATELSAGKNILINGNNHTFKKATFKYNQNLQVMDSALQFKAWITVDNATVELKDLVVDLNDANTGNTTTAVYVKGTNGVLTLSGNTVLKNGIGRAGNRSMAAEADGGATLIMKDNATITGFQASTAETSAGNSVIGIVGASKFIMNGGAITGNTVNTYGVIGLNDTSYNNNPDSRIEINAGSIKDNTELSDTHWAIKLRTNNSAYAQLVLGGNAEIEGLIGGGYGFAPYITGALNYPVTVAGYGLNENGKLDNDGNAIKGAYGNAIVRGLDYTLSNDDLLNVYWTDETDNGLVLYLDTNANGVYALDEGIEQRYPDIWITKAEAGAPEATPASIAITDAVLDNGTVTVSYTLSGDEAVEGKPIAAIYVGSELKGVNYAEASASLEAGEKTITVSTTLESLEGAVIKVFIWNAATIAPQVDVAER